jgi:hypothetical protein
VLHIFLPPLLTPQLTATDALSLCLQLQVASPFDSEPLVLGEASASITEQYWQHHFRRLFHKQVLLLLLPTFCDLLGAALLNIGEQWCMGHLGGVLGVGVGFTIATLGVAVPLGAAAAAAAAAYTV